MKKLTYSLILSAVIAIILISCGLPGGAAESQTVLPVAQATQSLSDLVSINLSVEYDTSVQYSMVGQVVAFKYKVNILKNDLTSDAPPNIIFSGASPVCPAVNTIGNGNDRLETGETFDCTLDYALTETDLNNGSVSANVTVNIYTVNSNTVSVNVPTIPPRALTLTVSASPTNYYQTGQTIVFTYTLKNSGSAQLGPAQFAVTDTLINAAAFNCGNADATIAPGATLTCTANYLVTQEDLSKASIANNATASGGGANPSQAVSVSVSKTTPPTGGTGTNVQHTVRNGEWLWQIARCYAADPVKTVEANPQLPNAAQLKEGMIVTVPNVGSTGKTVHAPPEPCVTLYTVKSSDTWSSIASAHGADPGFTQYVNDNLLAVGSQIKVPHYTAGMNFVVTNPTTPSAPTGTLSVVVSANPAMYSNVGQTITFSYTIRNNGTFVLEPDQYRITDKLIAADPFACGVPNTSLAPSATVTCSANYLITQDDMNKPSISNSATASGGGTFSSQAASTSIIRNATPLSLNAIPNPATYNQAGQTIAFTYIITNSTSSTLGPAQFTITDSLIGAAAFNCGDANTTLAPSATVTCTANYVITQDDMGKTSIANNAVASGGGAAPSQPVSKTITKQ